MCLETGCLIKTCIKKKDSLDLVNGRTSMLNSGHMGRLDTVLRKIELVLEKVKDDVGTNKGRLSKTYISNSLYDHLQDEDFFSDLHLELSETLYAYFDVENF